MGRHGRKFLETRARVDREREYQPAEAVALVKELKRAGFDESVEVHVRTGLNVRHADEQLRGTIALPNGLGKEVKIAVFAQGDKAREAEEAGADVVGGEDLAKRVQEGFTDFDVAIATPDMMPVVGRLGRILGPQGKMPNPKVGTVTPDIRRAVEESKAARSSTAPTARRSCTSSSARPASRTARSSRTTRRSWTRSSARSRRRPRAATSGR
jgi:large subunit ribosomal protein L1